MLWFLIALLVALCVTQFLYIRSIKRQVRRNMEILDDIYAGGNMDRRLFTKENSPISELIYKINDIVIQNKNQLIQLEKAEKAYKKLVTSLSHDIRTPLATLMGYLEVLAKGTAEKEEQALFLEIARTKTDQLNKYINTLFDWIKLESGEWVYHFEKSNICEQTRLILAEWILKLEKEKIQFQFAIPEEAVFLSIDKNAYGRILNNLLANVVKHSKADCVEITLGCELNQVLLIVSDNGDGIEEAELPHIFERLYKCDSARSESSNGLGLAITKELAAALNGNISVKSRKGGGTTFTVIFPKSEEC